MNLIAVNCHYQEYDFYCGRPKKGQKSPLANPYIIGQDGSREEVIEKYRQLLWRQLKAGNKDVVDELLRIYNHGKINEETRLGCWCKPKACHVDVITSALNSQKVIEIIEKRYQEYILKAKETLDMILSDETLKCLIYENKEYFIELLEKDENK